MKKLDINAVGYGVLGDDSREKNFSEKYTDYQLISHNTDTSSHQNRFSDIEAKICDRCDSLSLDISDVQGAVEANAERIDSSAERLDSRIDSLSQRASSLEESTLSHDAGLSAVASRVKSAETDINNHGTRLTEAESHISSLKTSAALASDEIALLKSADTELVLNKADKAEIFTRDEVISMCLPKKTVSGQNSVTVVGSAFRHTPEIYLLPQSWISGMISESSEYSGMYEYYLNIYGNESNSYTIYSQRPLFKVGEFCDVIDVKRKKLQQRILRVNVAKEFLLGQSVTDTVNNNPNTVNQICYVTLPGVTWATASLSIGQLKTNYLADMYDSTAVQTSSFHWRLSHNAALNAAYLWLIPPVGMSVAEYFKSRTDVRNMEVYAPLAESSYTDHDIYEVPDVVLDKGDTRIESTDAITVTYYTDINHALADISAQVLDS